MTVLRLRGPEAQALPKPIRPPAEATPREPHARWYQSPTGKRTIAHVNGNGLVQVSEELLDYLLTETGHVEVAAPAWYRPEHANGSQA